jgi:polysaccharide deacetylase family protein (PEP-CTERM system associated)
MTVDWEDFGQLYCWYEFQTIPEPRGDIERQTDIVLELLDEAGVHATFFVLGMLAKHRPDLVRKIHAEGHEIAVHGTSHVHLARLDREAAKRDISDAVDLISEIIGGPVHGFRAPIFSITRANLYVLDLLAELGLEYDSSIFPKAMPRYGIDGFDPAPRHYQLPEGGRIVELPLSVVPWCRWDWPVAGGGYVRLLPRMMLDPMVERLGEIGRPYILYTHPYEFDTEPIDVASNFPAGRRIPAWRRAAMNFKWNLFRGTFRGKTEHLLKKFSCSTCKEIADDIKNNQCTRLLG